jgi:hypothetical protein
MSARRNSAERSDINQVFLYHGAVARLDAIGRHHVRFDPQPVLDGLRQIDEIEADGGIDVD